MAEKQIKHVNTGCLYEKDGQKITILLSWNEAHFFDHSRMVNGTVVGHSLDVRKVVLAYLNGLYTHCTLPPEERYAMDKFYSTAKFEDWSSEYRWLIS